MASFEMFGLTSESLPEASEYESNDSRNATHRQFTEDKLNRMNEVYAKLDFTATVNLGGSQLVTRGGWALLEFHDLTWKVGYLPHPNLKPYS